MDGECGVDGEHGVDGECGVDGERTVDGGRDVDGERNAAPLEEEEGDGETPPRSLACVSWARRRDDGTRSGVCSASDIAIGVTEGLAAVDAPSSEAETAAVCDASTALRAAACDDEWSTVAAAPICRGLSTGGGALA